MERWPARALDAHQVPDSGLNPPQDSHLLGGEPALERTLTALLTASHYYAWLQDLIRPFVGRRVLDVGCGMGGLIPIYATANHAVALDVNGSFLRMARTRWGHLSHIRFVEGDICDPQLVAQLRAFGAPFDTVLLVNVIEHVPDDRRALAHAAELLGAGGHVVVYVPAHPRLFGRLDKGLGHCRRYSRADLEKRLSALGLTVVACRYVNTLGLLGWLVDNSVPWYDVIPLWQVRLFNACVPAWRRLEAFLRAMWPALPGLSILCVARKPHVGGAGQ